MPTSPQLRERGKLNKPRYLVLGLDPGIASCGFALLDLNNHEILEMGSHLFDAPVNPKNGVSLAVARRGFRSSRRNLDRTQHRLKHVMNLLKEEGVVPQDATKEYFHTTKGDKPPLELRVKALDERLEPREWALVLYSLCKRRGYIPHGETSKHTKSDDPDLGKVNAALEANTKLLEEGNFRTVGEWLNSLDQSRNRQGAYDKCITHAQIKDEVHILFESQRKFQNPAASAAVEDAFISIFDWEKPRDEFDKEVYDKRVGMCVYFPNLKRAASCTLSNEMANAYAKLGHITYKLPGQQNAKKLTLEQIEGYINILFSPTKLPRNADCKVTYSQIRKDLGLSAAEAFNMVTPEFEKQPVYDPKGWRTLRNSLVETAPELVVRLRANRDLADSVFESIAYSSTAPVLEKRLSELELTQEEIDAICEEVPYSTRVLNGYGTRSKLALDMLLDAFEDPKVRTLGEAEDATGLGDKRRIGNAVPKGSRLMPYLQWVALTGRSNNNYVVQRSMSRMRKVVNAVCNEWGVPHEIHIELDRELRLSKKKRDGIDRLNKRREADNKRIRETIGKEVLNCAPEAITNLQVLKYKMWEEQDNRDAYTGEAIDLKRMVEDETYTQIDHVLPYSRTGENSLSNKVLVLSSSNQLKRERTPYEWMTSGEAGAPNWDHYVARVTNSRNYWPRKREKLLSQEPLDEEKFNSFLQRSMNDTSYMSREVAAYLNDCLDFPTAKTKVHVQPTKGRATSWLRKIWGLNFGEDNTKDRSDDRHHAVDACVIAACSVSILQRCTKLSKRGSKYTSEHRAEELNNTLPWQSFIVDVKARRETVIPTRYVPQKGRGELYEQTNYAYVGMNEKGKHIVRAKDPKTGLPTDRVKGNVRISENGKSAMLVSEMLCLRLWHDKDAKGVKGTQGKWYADPVYKTDIPALKDGSYIPRIFSVGQSKDMWTPIPDGVLAQGNVIELYLGQAIAIGEFIGRYKGYNIANGSWKFENVLSRELISPKDSITINQLNNVIFPQIINEDVLGHCWENIRRHL